MPRFNVTKTLALLAIVVCMFGLDIPMSAQATQPAALFAAQATSGTGSIYAIGNNNQTAQSPPGLAASINPCRNTTVVGIYAQPARDGACAATTNNTAQPIGTRCGSSVAQTTRLAIGAPCTNGSNWPPSVNSDVWGSYLNSSPRSIEDRWQENQTGSNYDVTMIPAPLVLAAIAGSSPPTAGSTTVESTPAKNQTMNHVVNSHVRIHSTGSTATAIGNGSHASIGDVHVR